LVADRIDVSAAEKILKESDLNYRIIQSIQPGIVPTLNLGLENITSEFVARMYEDDVMSPERLQLQFNYLKKHKTALAVGGQLTLIDTENKIIGLASYRRTIALSYRHLFESSPVAHPAVMFRREIVNQIGGYRSFLPEDWDLWVRLREIGPIHNLRERVLNYRVHAGQLSREKMYAQAIGKQFVSTSYFARQESMRDYPESHEDPSHWLENTKSELRKTSRDFRKFELHSEKVEMINSVLQLRSKKARIEGIFSVFLHSPIFTGKYLAMRVIRKLKLKSNKSI